MPTRKELEDRVQELERKEKEREDNEQACAMLANKRFRQRHCNHSWEANDNMGRFYTCRKCGSLRRDW